MGRIADVKWAMFWSDAKFVSTEAFLPYKPLFDEEYQALEADDMDKVNRLQEQINELGLRLVDEAGEQADITNFMLHIYEDDVRFRADF